MIDTRFLVEVVAEARQVAGEEIEQSVERAGCENAILGAVEAWQERGAGRHVRKPFKLRLRRPPSRTGLMDGRSGFGIDESGGHGLASDLRNLPCGPSRADSRVRSISMSSYLGQQHGVHGTLFGQASLDGLESK